MLAAPVAKFYELYSVSLKTLDGRPWVRFQHDGALPHSPQAAGQLLRQILRDNWAGRLGPVSRSSRSLDLMPVDFYPGVASKAKYAQTNHDLARRPKSLLSLRLSLHPKLKEEAMNTIC